MMESFLDKFTKREKEVVLLIADGKTNKEIAACLKITEGTVKAYIHTILEKADLMDRRQIMLKVYEENKILSNDTKKA